MSSLAEFEALARQGTLVPVWRDLEADTETPVSAFLKLPEPSRAFLLESVLGGERWGRWSFLGDRPRACVRMEGHRVVCEENGGRSERELENPLDALRERLAPTRFVRPPGAPPFLGGWVGWLGHAAARWFEPRVPQRHGPDPDFPDGEWMRVDRLAVFDNLHHRLRVYALADLTEHASVEAAHRAALEAVDGLAEPLCQPLSRAQDPWRLDQVRDLWDREGFEAAVSRAKGYITAGDCMQVVISRRVEARWQGDPFRIYRQMRGLSPTPYLFHLRFGDRALVGASPELLVRLDGDRLTVRPIAGTRPRGGTAEEDLALEQSLRADPKELAEHVMLLDLGRNDVGRIARIGSVKIDEREVIERYSHVMHLVSQVSGRLLPGRDALDALAATLPAGTVSGAPKVRALEIIDELEPVSRGPYAGAVGYIGYDGSMDLAITIRAVALAGEKLRFQAGAGIVHDSDPSREYEETSHKLRAARVALGAFA